MTEHTLAWAAELHERTQTEVEVQYFGGSQAAFAETFGIDGESATFRLSPQADGDLGTKLFSALNSIAGEQGDEGLSKIVFVGTDCPELDADFVDAAFHLLDDHDVCFAPAEDGGYVLLGVRVSAKTRVTEFEALFRNIDWGTENVLRQSLAAIQRQPFKVGLLPTLHDIDLPEDLPVWHDAIRRARHAATQPLPATATPRLSVLIPTKDSERGLSGTLDRVQSEPTVEVIVAATGDCTETRALCAERGVQLVECPMNRGQQWNAAVEASAGDCLLLLHADTKLPERYAEAIESCLDLSGVVAGAFQLQIDSPSSAARWIEKGVKFRSVRRQFPYGDQAIFLRRETLEKVGGVPCQPIMEDFELVRKLRRIGRIAIAGQSVITSARRWQRLGWLKTTLINQVMVVGYYLGVPLARLGRFYRGRS